MISASWLSSTTRQGIHKLSNSLVISCFWIGFIRFIWTASLAFMSDFLIDGQVRRANFLARRWLPRDRWHRRLKYERVSVVTNISRSTTKVYLFFSGRSLFCLRCVERGWWRWRQRLYPIDETGQILSTGHRNNQSPWCWASVVGETKKSAYSRNDPLMAITDRRLVRSWMQHELAGFTFFIINLMDGSLTSDPLLGLGRLVQCPPFTVRNDVHYGPKENAIIHYGFSYMERQLDRGRHVVETVSRSAFSCSCFLSYSFWQ